MVKIILDSLNSYSNLITAFSVLVGAGAAVYGVKEWRRQLKGKTDYELARRYLRSVYKLRDAIKFVRNPFISIEEMDYSLKEHGFDSIDYSNNIKTNRAVYSTRWKKVIEASSDLSVELLEAEVSWGVEAIDIQKSLDKCVRELFVALEMFLSEHIKTLKENELIYDIGEKDQFRKKIEESIKKIEEYLKPHLR